MSYLVKEILNVSKDSSISIYIYGAGELANMISKCILDRGGRVEAFLVDDEYYSSEIKMNKTICIRPLSILNKIDCEYRLVIGFEGDYLKGISKAGIREDVVLAADFLGYLASGGENAKFEYFYESNKGEFERVRALLSDEKSRISFDEYIKQKISGNYCKDYDISLQYFDDDIIGTRLSDRELFLDCGAFKGETALAFIEYLHKKNISKFEGIVEFEPDKSNIDSLKLYLPKMNNIEIVEAGVYNKSTRLSFISKNGSASKFDTEGNDYVDVVSIDEYIEDDRKEKVTFIKMDIEGSELMALYGAAQIIKKYRPKLAICVYHRLADLIDIPKYIKFLNEDYLLYLRNYSRCGVETVLYAV